VDEPGLEVTSAAAEAVMPNRPDSTPAARVFLSRLLNGWGLAEEVIDDASLLATELVSNAVRHGSGQVTLQVEVDQGVLQVRVHDDAVELPVVHDVDPTSLGGRGLFIVECVADEWGSDPADAGKSVWFRLKAPRQDEERGYEDGPT
jgi:anti-sigma regulatory factor (Ser/Thr protein kinase)